MSNVDVAPFNIDYTRRSGLPVGVCCCRDRQRDLTVRGSSMASRK